MYFIFIQTYTFLIRLSALFGNVKARKWIEGRKNILRRIQSTIPSTEPLFWIHCASLGEFEQGRPVIENLKQKYPDIKILLTFFSPSGYESKKNYKVANYIFYLPIDTRHNVRFFVKHLNIKLAIFVKYEFWKNYFKQLYKNKIPLFLISSIFRKNQLFFKWYGKSYRKMLYWITHIFVQDKHSLDLLHSININNVTISGDTRFDRVVELKNVDWHDDVISHFISLHKNKPVLVAGSTWQEDEKLLFNYIKKHPNFAYIVAPHEITNQHINFIKKQSSLPLQVYTEYENSNDANILIMNTIGLLNKVYRYAQVAYIGGGFGAGIHNILEAATYGVPIVFGPNYKKFKEARDLIVLGGAFSISNYEMLERILNKFMESKTESEKFGKIAENYVVSNAGATQNIIQTISKYI